MHDNTSYFSMNEENPLAGRWFRRQLLCGNHSDVYSPGDDEKDMSGGMAVSAVLGLIVVSWRPSNTIRMYDVVARGFVRVGTFGQGQPDAAMNFKFTCVNMFCGGRMAFSEGVPGARTRPLLLVADAGHNSVHVLDVVSRRHEGYINAAGAFGAPQSIATHGSLVAFSCAPFCSTCAIWLYERSSTVAAETTWLLLRTVRATSFEPVSYELAFANIGTGLQFVNGGTHLAVPNCTGSSVHILRIADERAVDHVVYTDRAVSDVRECSAGLLVSLAPITSGGISFNSTIHLFRKGNRCPHNIIELQCLGDCLAFDLVRGLGLVVLTDTDCLLMQTAEEAAMRTMSFSRVAWMACVVRAHAQFETY